jgi:predicted PhzF superfamily epimerase YddE/YHI9
MTTSLEVLRVFIGPDGRGGNPLGVFRDGAAIEPSRRQAVAAELGFSETVFIDAHRGADATIRIFTPAAELPFAGHPTVGTAWLLAEGGLPDVTLHVPAGEVVAWRDAERTWIRARPEWVHRFTSQQLADAAAVEAFEGPPADEDNLYVWAWQDEAAGRLRARYFPRAFGIAEDEATGAAAVSMGGRLGRPLTIRQGVGSEILVRPGPDGTVEIGGRVERVEVRPFG